MRKPSTERGGNFPRSHSKCQMQDLHSGLLNLNHISFSFSRDCNPRCYGVSQAAEMQEAGWLDVEDYGPVQTQRNPREPTGKGSPGGTNPIQEDSTLMTAVATGIPSPACPHPVPKARKSLLHKNDLPSSHLVPPATHTSLTAVHLLIQQTPLCCHLASVLLGTEAG